MISLSLASNATQRILSQANNLSYAVRDGYRMGSVPEDRKADYMFRHYWMVLNCAMITETGFRATEKFVSFPQITKLLGLNRLKELYGNDPKFKNIEIQNYRSIEDIPMLRNRLSGSLVKESSAPLIPNLIRDVDLPHATQAEKEQADVLIHHLQKYLNFDGHNGFLTELEKDSPEVVRMVRERLKALDTGKSHLGKIKTMMEPELGKIAQSYRSLFPFSQEALAQHAQNNPLKLTEETRKTIQTIITWATENKLIPDGALISLQQKLADEKVETIIKAELGPLAAALSKTQEVVKKGVEQLEATVEKSLADRVKQLFQEGLNSKTIMSELKTIQKSSFWPKMLISNVLTLVFYGIIVSMLDVHVVQPWQKKLYEKRGTTNEVVMPTFISTIPGVAGILGVLSDKIMPQAIRRMDNLNRFLLASAVGFTAYAGTALFLINRKLKQPPPKPPRPAEPVPSFQGISPLRHPNTFQLFEHHRRF
jgi:hypothetical protein